MCGRYTLADPQAIPARFDTVNKEIDFEVSYNIAPGFRSPVIFEKGDGRIVELMKWGLIPFWADNINIGYEMINARSEGIEDKPAYRVPVRRHRCLVPATGFYEWKSLNLEGKTEKFPWYYRVKDNDVFAFAGIFDIWKDKEDHEIKSFSIITSDSNDLVNKVHPRMPVILEQEEEEGWIDVNTDLDHALDLLDQYPSDKMESRPVSRRVNSPKNDDRRLIEPVKRPEPKELFK